MKKKILEFTTGSQMSSPQGKFLYNLTGQKFWQPESLPSPTMKQASILIGGMIAYNKKESSFLWKEHKEDPGIVLDNLDILECIQLWFPSIERMEQIRPHFFKKRKPGQEHDNEEEQPE